MIIKDKFESKRYLIDQLKFTCDADPEALSDYILALLGHDKPMDELRIFCIEQLQDFLHENTKTIVDRILDHFSGRNHHKKSHSSDEDHDRDYRRGGKRSLEEGYYHQNQNQHYHSSNSQSHYSERNRSHEYERDHHDDRYNRNKRSNLNFDKKQSLTHPIVMLPPPPPPGFFLGTNVNNANMGIGTNGTMITADSTRNNIFNNNKSNSNSNSNSFNNSSRIKRIKKNPTNKLLIENIPMECCNLAKIHEHFNRFGQIITINVIAEENKATVQYGNINEATIAYQSSEPIFNNRFVKLSFDSPEKTISKESLLPSTLSTLSASFPNLSSSNEKDACDSMEEEKIIENKNFKGSEEMEKFKSSSPPTTTTSSSLLTNSNDLQRRKQELVEKCKKQKKELVSMLENNGIFEIEREKIINSLNNLENSINILENSKSPIMPSSASPSPSVIINIPIISRHVAPSNPNIPKKYNLDLRPSSLILRSPIPSKIGSDMISIRKYFEPYGSIQSITMMENENGAFILYANRKDAEKALFYMPKADFDGESLNLTWYKP